MSSDIATHRFDAVAFADDFALRDIATLFPAACSAVEGLRLDLDGGGTAFFYPFGAVAFADASRDTRDAVLARLPVARRGRGSDVVREDFAVRVSPKARIAVAAGALELDTLSVERAGVVALIVAQSAAMEYYERIVDQLFARTGELVAGLERDGRVPLRMRPLHRFIGEAVGTRSEVLTVLHLLDKPDAVWDDPAMDRIYADLRDEFDLGDRFDALEIKLRAVQESLELLLDATRDRRLELLEVAIVLLIVLEIVLGLMRLM